MDVSIACYFPDSSKAMGTAKEVYRSRRWLWQGMEKHVPKFFVTFCLIVIKK